MGRVLRLRAVRAPELRPGSEEYLDSEKYQLRPRDFAAAIADGRSLAPFIARLNRIRRDHPALHQLRNLHIHAVDNDDITAFSKRDEASGDTVLVVCNLNPHETREATVTLDLDALSACDWDRGFTVHDLLTGASTSGASATTSGSTRTPAGARLRRPTPHA